LLPQSKGYDYEDFEVTFRAFKTTTVTATYNIYDAAHTQIGTAKITFKLNAADEPNTSITVSTGGFGEQYQIQGGDGGSPYIVSLPS
jgi:hypothetical protein